MGYPIDRDRRVQLAPPLILAMGSRRARENGKKDAGPPAFFRRRLAEERANRSLQIKITLCVLKDDPAPGPREGQRKLLSPEAKVDKNAVHAYNYR